VLGWQQEGVRWLLRAEAVLGGGLLADGTLIFSFSFLYSFLSLSSFLFVFSSFIYGIIYGKWLTSRKREKHTFIFFDKKINMLPDMGLGKTLQSLLLYKAYHKPIGPTLILCKPVSILFISPPVSILFSLTFGCTGLPIT
jgi:SNF2 family DNA or RNA helicase